MTQALESMMALRDELTRDLEMNPGDPEKMRLLANAEKVIEFLLHPPWMYDWLEDARAIPPKSRKEKVLLDPESYAELKADQRRLDKFFEHPWALINEDGDFPSNRDEFDSRLESESNLRIRLRVETQP